MTSRAPNPKIVPDYKRGKQLVRSAKRNVAIAKRLIKEIGQRQEKIRR